MRKAAVLAVAKDEGCYLAEFIHHHLYFGFERIFIAVNRTTDNSRKILERIHGEFDNVHFIGVDWIDWAKYPKEKKNLRIQQVSYAFLIDHIQQRYADVQYVLPIDVDEFWFHRNFSTSVTDFLSMKFDILSFHWLCQDGEAQPFLPPFKTISVSAAKHVKTIINLDSACEIDTLRNHTPLYKQKEKVIHLHSSGSDFHPTQGQLSSEVNLSDQKAFILHRMARSEEEYIYLMMRGNTDSDTTVKPNRNGFKFLSGRFDLNLPTDKLDAYHHSLTVFCERTGIEALIEQDRKNLLKRQRDLYRMDARQILGAFDPIIKGFVGTDALHELLEIVRSAKGLNTDQIEIIKNKGMAVQKTNPELSKKLILLAEKKRPKDSSKWKFLNNFRKHFL